VVFGHLPSPQTQPFIELPSIKEERKVGTELLLKLHDDSERVI
jgi:hypothetical protein